MPQEPSPKGKEIRIEDILARLERLNREHGMPEDLGSHEHFVEAMEGALEAVETECQISGRQFSESERAAIQEKYFRIEARELGLTDAQIEARWRRWAEAMKIVAEVKAEQDAEEKKE